MKQFRLFGRILCAWTLGLVAASAAQAQDRPKQDEFAQFEQYRTGSAAVEAGAAEIFDRVAKYYAGRLSDPEVQRSGMSALVQEFSRRLLLPPQNAYDRLSPQQKKFVEEFGKAMIAQLEPLVLSNPKVIVRVNAMRMAAEVGKMGYDGAAELCVKALEKPDDVDSLAVKLYALKGLHYLFEIEPDKQVQPARTIFQKKPDLQLTPLERKSILALIAFIMRNPNLPPDAASEEVDAVRYLRAEAIRALGRVRVQSVKNLGQVEARPALTLLKVARSDGLNPPTNVKERVEAIIGFAQLLPDRDRDLQVRYAVYHLGQALAELADYKNTHPQDTTVPWKVSAVRIRDALEQWRTEAENLKLDDARLIREFLDLANLNVLEALAAGKEGLVPNVEALRAFLANIDLTKTPSLFKSDPSTTLSVK
jgi:hypothetical protein